MKRFLLYSLLGAFTALVAFPAMADEVFSIKPSFISLSPEGQFEATALGITGTKMDVDQTLGLGRSNSGTVEASLHLGNFRLTGSYMPLNFSGSKPLGQTVNFNGQAFTAGTSINSKLEMDIFDIGLTYYILNFDDLPMRIQIGPELSVKAIRASVSLTGAALGLSENKSATAPIPTLGLRGKVALADFLGLTFRAGGMAYAGNSFVDGEVQVEFSPIPLVGLNAGYRYVDVKVDESSVFVDASFSGPFLGAFIRF